MMTFRLGAVSLQYRRLIGVLIISNGLSVFLFAARVFGSDGFRYWFMLWNLFLAWLPLLFAALLVRRLQTKPWTNWVCLLLTVLWLMFLPNSFYMLTDLIHLQSTGEINVLFDAAMFSSFIFNGFVAGFISVFLMHRLLLKRVANADSHAIIGLVFLVCGYAIYLGRSLRWNSWDALLHPAGVLFDVSEGIVNPLAHPQLFVTTMTFFALLSAMYAVLYQIFEVVRSSQHR